MLKQVQHDNKMRPLQKMEQKNMQIKKFVETQCIASLLGNGFKPFRRVILIVVIFCFLISSALAVRIKDIATIKGMKSNQLIGYGIIVGLQKTGDDDSVFTNQSVRSMLQKMGISIPANEDIKIDNSAAVIVTASLPPFAQIGSQIDVIVSSIGDAESLQGGTLLATPLRALNGEVYGVAQGPVSIGGFNAGSGAGTGDRIYRNHPTAGQIPSGAIIEKEIPSNFQETENITFTLFNPDFTTALRVANAINTNFSNNIAIPTDAGAIVVNIPKEYINNKVAFTSILEGFDVNPDSRAKVILDERTGTVVMGKDVRISTVAIAHGNLTIQINMETQVAQPLPFSQGETVVIPKAEVTVSEESKPLSVIPEGVNISEIVRALNALGASPRDLIAIFQAIKAAGALQADLEII